MAVKYAIAKAVTGKEKKVHYYARAAYDGETSLEDIAQMVEKISAISYGDVLSVLNTLGSLISIELSNGRIVDLGDLGRMRLTLRSKSVATPDEVKSETVQSSRVIFVPGQAIRQKQCALRLALTSEAPQPRKKEDKPHDEPVTPTPGTGGSSDNSGDQLGV